MIYERPRSFRIAASVVNFGLLILLLLPLTHNHITPSTSSTNLPQTCTNQFNLFSVIFNGPICFLFLFFFILVFDGVNRSTGIYDKFASALSNAVQKMQVGDGFHEGVLQVISCAPYATLIFPGRIDGTIFI